MAVDQKAVIFDSDGTLLDTRELIYQSYEHTLQHHGHDVPDRARIAEHMGKEVLHSYLALAPGGDARALVDHHRAWQLDQEHLVAAYAGVHELLRRIRADGFKIGVCTSRGKRTDTFLRAVGIRDDIDALITADDVQSHKPHPEPIHLALSQLLVESSRAAMVGDTTADIGAGRAANLKLVIGVTHGFHSRETLHDAGADHIVDHLPDILPLIEAL